MRVFLSSTMPDSAACCAKVRCAVLPTTVCNHKHSLKCPWRSQVTADWLCTYLRDVAVRIASGWVEDTQSELLRQHPAERPVDCVLLDHVAFHSGCEAAIRVCASAVNIAALFEGTLLNLKCKARDTWHVPSGLT